MNLKRSGVLVVAAVSGLVVGGCSGVNAPARNVRETTSIMSLGGVPGAGAVGLAATVIEAISKVKFEQSPGFNALFEKYAKEKRVRSFVKWERECRERFAKGEWGDNDASINKNTADFEVGKVIGVAYSTADNGGFSLIYSYSKGADKVQVMTPDEWDKKGKREK